MKVHATVCTVPTSDTPGSSLLIHFDERRYIFGQVCEGSQRQYVEQKVRSGKVQDIFLTGRTEWANVGGLVGFLLTIGDARKPGDVGEAARPITVHGGKNILHFIAATRNFVFRGQLKMKADEIDPSAEVYRDDNLIINALHIKPTGGEPAQLSKKRSAEDMQTPQEKLALLKEIVEGMFFISQKSINKTHELEETDQLVMGDGEPEGKKSRTISEDEENELPDAAEGQQPKKTYPPPPPSRHVKMPKSTPSPVALSYTLMMHDQRGKFFPKIARDLGVKPGPDFGLLSLGQSVTTASGRVVESHEVLGPARPGTGMVVGDLPSVEYLGNFVSHREWDDEERVKAKFGCFYWILGAGVAHHPQFVAFIKRFPKAQHIIASPDLCEDRINFKGAAKFTTRLNVLDSNFFPSLHAGGPGITPPEGALAAQPGLSWNIEPAWSLNTENIAENFDAEAAVSESEAGKDFLASAMTTRELLFKSPPRTEIFPGSDVEVYTLGTGSAIPSRYRNVSGTLVTIPNTCSILLDCGENTIGQMRRVLGPTFNQRLLDIHILYISHLHADHHLGSISMLKTQRQLLHSTGNGLRRTFVVAPLRFWAWLEEYSSVEDFGLEHLTFIPCEHMRYSSTKHFVWPEGYGEMMSALAIRTVETAPAMHCQSSFTMAMSFSNGFKLAYSGDTRPTSAFTQIGKGATLLVHEATFDDELLEEALMKKHSTIGEAIKAGKDMGARKTCLVHFSQRYPKAPVFGDDAGDVVYGFDYMRFKVGEVNRFQKLVKGIEEIYKSVEEAEEEVNEEEEEAAAAAAAAAEKVQKAPKAKKMQKQGKKENQIQRIINYSKGL